MVGGVKQIGQFSITFPDENGAVTANVATEYPQRAEAITRTKCVDSSAAMAYAVAQFPDGSTVVASRAVWGLWKVFA